MEIKDGVLISIFGPSDIKNGRCIIPDGVTSIGRFAFENCKSLTSIVIPSSVISIGDYAFMGCSSLTSITILNSITSIGRFAFFDCSRLPSIKIPSGVANIGYSAFRNCSDLTSITIPNSLTRIDYRAFYNCNKLRRPSISATTIKAVKGFYKNKDKLVCNDFVYEVGKTYKEPRAKLCEMGFHACTLGLDVFNYYAGEDVAFYEVKLSGISPERRDDSKICGKKITLLRELSLAEAANYVSKTEEV